MRKPGFISLCILTTSMLFLLFTFPAKAKIRTYPKRILFQTMMAQARCSIAS